MRKRIDLTGKRFGRLIVVKDAGRAKSSHALWECRCDCGNVVIVRESNIKRKGIKSCGCLHEVNLAGQRFGRLVVIKKAARRTSNGSVCWECECVCGKRIIATGPHLRKGCTKSCGCLRKELSAERATIHGKHSTVEYETWSSMIKRCTNPNRSNYKYYGGRGITVCDRWLGSFEAFYEDMGKKPKGLTLERIDNDGNYEPGNCKWATYSEQNSNKRSKHIAD